MAEEPVPRGLITRQAILNAAHQLFVQQGYHGTSMRQIAEAAGIGLSSLYNYFQSKEGVFRNVFFEFHPYHTVLPVLRNAQGDSIEGFVRDGARLIASTLDDRPEFMNLMFIEIVEFNSAHMNELFEHIIPQALEIVSHLASMPGRHLRPIPPQMLIRTLLGTFIGYYFTSRIIPNDAPNEFTYKSLDYFVDIYLRGILSDQSEVTPA